MELSGGKTELELKYGITKESIKSSEKDDIDDILGTKKIDELLKKIDNINVIQGMKISEQPSYVDCKMYMTRENASRLITILTDSKRALQTDVKKEIENEITTAHNDEFDKLKKELATLAGTTASNTKLNIRNIISGVRNGISVVESKVGDIEKKIQNNIADIGKKYKIEKKKDFEVKGDIRAKLKDAEGSIVQITSVSFKNGKIYWENPDNKNLKGNIKFDKLCIQDESFPGNSTGVVQEEVAPVESESEQTGGSLENVSMSRFISYLKQQI